MVLGESAFVAADGIGGSVAADGGVTTTAEGEVVAEEGADAEVFPVPPPPLHERRECAEEEEGRWRGGRGRDLPLEDKE